MFIGISVLQLQTTYIWTIHSMSFGWLKIYATFRFRLVTLSILPPFPLQTAQNDLPNQKKASLREQNPSIRKKNSSESWILTLHKINMTMGKSTFLIGDTSDSNGSFFPASHLSFSRVFFRPTSCWPDLCASSRSQAWQQNGRFSSIILEPKSTWENWRKGIPSIFF